MYKAIIFDLGKVLVHFDFKRGYRELEGLCPYPAAEIPRRLAPTGLVFRFETGQMEPRDFVEQVSRALDLNVTYERFCEIWGGIFCHTLVPESLLEGLAVRYRLLLMSNTNQLHFEIIRRNYPLIRHFHHLILSHEVGAMKPSPEIYRAAIARAGCRPEECFFTDDMPDFVEGARKLGIDAVQFQSAEQLEGELRSRGITW